MKEISIQSIKEKMDQFLIDNPTLNKNSLEYLTYYRKINYQEKKEQYKAYQKEYRDKVKSCLNNRIKNPNESFLKDLNKFIYILKLKEFVTLIDLLKIVVYWSECNDQSILKDKFKSYNKYPNNKQLEFMWKDINTFNDKWKKLIL